ncbi:MAG TPA: hypothetical protein VIA18_26965 [Polyangia bacterium]|jgi:hypothetical protein|nr:hypothetical protein [Polyangia bacterium]
MQQRFASFVRLAGASVFAVALLPGCQLFQNNATDGGTDTTASWTSLQMEVTIAQGVHYGPGVPSGSATLINSRDDLGNLNGGVFTLDATVDSAECVLSLSRFGAGTGFAVGTYAISAEVGDTTPNNVAYPQGGESVLTPAGNATCNGSDCDGASLVLNQVDSAHVYGYFLAGSASSPLTCTFYLPLAEYVP